MSDEKKKIEDSEFSEEKSILRITDELVRQVDRTKKMILIMILVVVVAIPVLWHLAPVISSSFFVLVGYGTVAIAAVFLAIGVRQWLILSKWTRRYKLYKELQRKVDEKLDFNGKGEV